MLAAPYSGRVRRHWGEIRLQLSDYQAVVTSSFREGRLSFRIRRRTQSASFPSVSLTQNLGLQLRIRR